MTVIFLRDREMVYMLSCGDFLPGKDVVKHNKNAIKENAVKQYYCIVLYYKWKYFTNTVNMKTVTQYCKQVSVDCTVTCWHPAATLS